MKRLAIQLNAHLRTYKDTYKKFFENIVEVNKKDGYEIDIFIYTWDKWSARSKRKMMNPSLNNKPVSDKDIKELLDIYKPKSYKIAHLPDGANGQITSLLKVIELREAYEKEQNIKYDWILTTRFDIYFLTPLRIDYFIDAQENFHWFQARNEFWQEKKFPKTPHRKVFFVDCQNTWIPMIDYRHCTNEADLCYFSNFSCATPWARDFEPLEELLLLPIKYKMFDDFLILRDMPCLNAKRYEYLAPLNLDEKDLEKDLNLLSLKTKIRHSLAYQLGQALIISSKSFWGILSLPFILTYIAKKYRSLHYSKLPAFKDYYWDQHEESLKIKEHLSYKLGEALIKRNKEASNNVFKFALTGGGL